MKKIAIIGAGIVGSTAAYYLSKVTDYEMTVFDEGVGQATKAAAGIISPWFSKRRNKAWYKMARLGADFYQTLVEDLKADGFSTDFYQQSGVYLLKKNEEKLEELYELGKSRRTESPLIGELKIINREEVNAVFPSLQGFEKLLYASGGARVEGSQLTSTLLAASGVTKIKKKVCLQRTPDGYEVDGQLFDCVLVTAGAWLGQLLSPLSYEVDVRPQKGQLRDYQLEMETNDYPVVMPEGELDIIPFLGGKMSVGASHENDRGFDLTPEQAVLEALEAEAMIYYPVLAQASKIRERVGIRAYTSDFSPFYGSVPHEKALYVASGLGSSGLTTGPLIGYELAQMVQGEKGWLDSCDYPVSSYVQKRG
ncbi:FAD-dependent oxidoreductase [Streptococcus pneumoniae]